MWPTAKSAFSSSMNFMTLFLLSLKLDIYIYRSTSVGYVSAKSLLQHASRLLDPLYKCKQYCNVCARQYCYGPICYTVIQHPSVLDTPAIRHISYRACLLYREQGYKGYEAQCPYTPPTLPPATVITCILLSLIWVWWLMAHSQGPVTQFWLRGYARQNLKWQHLQQYVVIFK